MHGIQRLIQAGEGQFLEFKKKPDHPDKIVREMVAFANSGGGTLLIGVDDSGKITGLAHPDEEVYVMEAAIARHASPEIDYKLESVPVGSGRWVLKYQILPGTDKPYYWLESPGTGKGIVYVRCGEASIRASFQMYRILKSEKSAKPLKMGDFELKLFSMLSSGVRLNIQEISLGIGIAKRKVSDRLVNLVLQGVLTIEPGMDGDIYSLSDAFSPEAFC
jgi:hypothetical protein